MIVVVRLPFSPAALLLAHCTKHMVLLRSARFLVPVPMPGIRDSKSVRFSGPASVAKTEPKASKHSRARVAPRLRPERRFLGKNLGEGCCCPPTGQRWFFRGPHRIAKPTPSAPSVAPRRSRRAKKRRRGKQNTRPIGCVRATHPSIESFRTTLQNRAPRVRGRKESRSRPESCHGFLSRDPGRDNWFRSFRFPVAVDPPLPPVSCLVDC